MAILSLAGLDKYEYVNLNIMDNKFNHCSHSSLRLRLELKQAPLTGCDNLLDCLGAGDG